MALSPVTEASLSPVTPKLSPCHNCGDFKRNVGSLILILMSLGSMSHDDFNKKKLKMALSPVTNGSMSYVTPLEDDPMSRGDMKKIPHEHCDTFFIPMSLDSMSLFFFFNLFIKPSSHIHMFFQMRRCDI